MPSKLSKAAVERIKDKVSMPKGEFKSEHKKLVGILKHGSRAAQKSEARKQAKEASEY
jgi:hypothetical protein